MLKHKLYTFKDFEHMTWEEKETNQIYYYVVECGFQICKVCGQAEGDLKKECLGK